MAQRRDYGGIIGLLIVVALLAGGYFLFPAVQRTMSYQDCIASGRVTGC